MATSGRSIAFRSRCRAAWCVPCWAKTAPARRRPFAFCLVLTEARRRNCHGVGLDSTAQGQAVRSRVGYVAERPTLYEWMTVSEIGWFTAGFYGSGFFERYLRLAAEYHLPLKRKIKSLSKGMRAKVSLALALAHEPELLILDEPTSGLDTLVRREFLEGMVDIAAAGSHGAALQPSNRRSRTRGRHRGHSARRASCCWSNGLDDLKDQIRELNITLAENLTVDARLRRRRSSLPRRHHHQWQLLVRGHGRRRSDRIACAQSACKNWAFARRRWKKFSWPISSCRCRRGSEPAAAGGGDRAMSFDPVRAVVMEGISRGTFACSGCRSIVLAVVVSAWPTFWYSEYAAWSVTTWSTTSLWPCRPSSRGRRAAAFAVEQEEGTFDFLQSAPVSPRAGVRQQAVPLRRRTWPCSCCLWPLTLVHGRQCPRQGSTFRHAGVVAPGSRRSALPGARCFRCSSPGRWWRFAWPCSPFPLSCTWRPGVSPVPTCTSSSSRRI